MKFGAFSNYPVKCLFIPVSEVGVFFAVHLQYTAMTFDIVETLKKFFNDAPAIQKHTTRSFC